VPDSRELERLPRQVNGCSSSAPPTLSSANFRFYALTSHRGGLLYDSMADNSEGLAATGAPRRRPSIRDASLAASTYSRSTTSISTASLGVDDANGLPAQRSASANSSPTKSQRSSYGRRKSAGAWPPFVSRGLVLILLLV
jgi:hypothetical protein